MKTPTTTYHDRLRALIAARGALCVGLDPNPAALRAWGLPDDVDGAARLALGMVEAVGDLVACFKPQSACFEVWGSAGVRVLEAVVAAARRAGALVVVDAKRGDIGSTMAAYARAYLGDGPLAGDAVTLSPYLGFEALEPALAAAEANGRGVYVVARSSNPEGGDLQLAVTAAGTNVAQSLVDRAAARNRASGLNAVGLVVGGTHAELGIDLSGFTGSLLVPGVGPQGGTMAAVRRQFACLPALVLPTASREVMGAGPDPERLRAKVQSLLAL